MTKKQKYWKSHAKRTLSGKWGIAIVAMLTVQIVNIIGNLLSLILFPENTIWSLILGEIFVFAVSLIGSVFSTGYCHMRLNMYRGREYGMKDLLYAFRNQPDHVLVAAFVLAILNIVAQIPATLMVYLTDPGSTLDSVILWCQNILIVMVLGLVLGVILTVPFVLAFYLLADNPDMGGIEALKTSVRYMKGHKWNYLMLELSFVPLLFLSMLTWGFGFLWLLPYMEFTETSFYLYVTGELDQNKNNSNEGEYNGYYSGDNQGA